MKIMIVSLMTMFALGGCSGKDKIYTIDDLYDIYEAGFEVGWTKGYEKARKNCEQFKKQKYIGDTLDEEI